MYPDMSPEVRKVAYQVYLWLNVVLFVATAAIAVVTKELPTAVVVAQTVVNALGISVGFTAQANTLVTDKTIPGQVVRAVDPGDGAGDVDTDDITEH